MDTNNFRNIMQKINQSPDNFVNFEDLAEQQTFRNLEGPSSENTSPILQQLFMQNLEKKVSVSSQFVPYTLALLESPTEVTFMQEETTQVKRNYAVMNMDTTQKDTKFNETIGSPTKKLRTSTDFPIYIDKTKTLFDIILTIKNIKKSQLIPFISLTNLLNFENPNFIGTCPKLFKDIKVTTLGVGAFKTITAISILNKCPSKSKNKTGWKEVAYTSLNHSSIFNILKVLEKKFNEIRVLELLKTHKEYAKYTPKIYFAGIESDQIVIITKVISGGDAKLFLSKMTHSNKLKALADFGKGLEMLHKLGIIHNDVCSRNMLIDFPVKSIKLEDAKPSQMLARPIFDKDGRIIISNKKWLNTSLVKQLADLDIQEIKIFDDSLARGFVIDFDLCTFINDVPVANGEINFALDCTAPERFDAIIEFDRNYKVFCTNSDQNKINKLSEGLDKLVKSILDCTNSKSDAFSFGLLILNTVLRPDLDTDFLIENSNYIDNCNVRSQRWSSHYKHFVNNSPEYQNNLSALENNDRDGLKSIDPKLAELVFNLMRYDPAKRPEISESISQLYLIIEELNKTSNSSP